MKLQWIIMLTLLYTVKSRPNGPEDVYGDLLDGEEEEGVQNDDHDDYKDYIENSAPEENNDTVKNYEISAELRTKPQVFVARIGETVYLPCEVSNPDLVVLVWRKNEKQLLYQGDAAIGSFKNLRKHPNGTLEINIRSESDFDKYTCQMLISPHDNPEVVHTVVSLDAAKIVALLTADNKTVYHAGETLKLTCVTTGYPKPKISWHRGSESLGVTGESILIENLKFRMAGFYRCLAENNVGAPAHSALEIHVEHKPTITIEKYLVNSDKEHEAELKCTVRAYPQAVVVWKKNGTNIIEDKPKITLKKHDRNTENVLLITNLTNSDFGNYTCSATNGLGRAEETVSLVKIPAIQEFSKPEKSNRDVVLTWKVESKSPIHKHQLQYKKIKDENWKELYPEVVNSENDIYTVKYTLKGLEPGSYETRVRSQNTHGWSEYSDTVPFEGEKHSTTPIPHEKNEETVVGESQTAGTTSVVSSISLISIVLLILFDNRQ